MSNQEGSSLSSESGEQAEEFSCQRCGYCLRGLEGDPIVCPECAFSNRLEHLSIDPEAIAKELRRLETFPTLCFVALCLAAVGGAMLVVLRSSSGLPVGVVGLASFGVLAVVFGRSCEFRPGWFDVLLWFCAYGLLLVALPVVFVVLLMVNLRWHLLSDKAFFVVFLVVGLAGFSSRVQGWVAALARNLFGYRGSEATHKSVQNRLRFLCGDIVADRALKRTNQGKQLWK